MTITPLHLNTHFAYISVDVETAGPHPGEYALLSIGACLVAQSERQFYIELQPDRAAFTHEALEIGGLSLETLAQTGTPPRQAMIEFDTWVQSVTPAQARPVFVAFNAPFDWMFINEYFYRYLGRNPFGHSALDIKALYMGARGAPWEDTSFAKISTFYGGSDRLKHNALEDALEQGNLFHRILDDLILTRQE